MNTMTLGCILLLHMWKMKNPKMELNELRQGLISDYCLYFI